MNRPLNLSNDQVVKNLHWQLGEPDRYSVKDESHKGLYLRVSKGGGLRWYFQFRRHGKLWRNWYGNYPKVSCAKAMIRWETDQKDLTFGINPVLKKREAEETLMKAGKQSSLTLSRLFHNHYFPKYAQHKRSWRHDEHYFRTRIEPVIGNIPAANITWRDIEKLVVPIRRTQYNTARLTVATLRKMYNWAASLDSANEPGGDPLLDMLNPCSKTKFNPRKDPEAPSSPLRALKRSEIRALWGCLSDSNSDRILKLMLLTGCRVAELCGMRERELDRESCEWQLPAIRSKSNRDLIIPLTDKMIEIIGPLTNDYIFRANSLTGHTTTSGPSQAMFRHLRDLKIDLPPRLRTHVLRKTFSTVAAQIGISREIRNRLTNHADTSVDGVHYNAYDYIREQKTALESIGKEIYKSTDL